MSLYNDYVEIPIDECSVDCSDLGSLKEAGERLSTKRFEKKDNFDRGLFLSEEHVEQMINNSILHLSRTLA